VTEAFLVAEAFLAGDRLAVAFLAVDLAVDPLLELLAPAAGEVVMGSSDGFSGVTTTT